MNIRVENLDNFGRIQKIGFNGVENIYFKYDKKTLYINTSNDTLIVREVRRIWINE